MRTLWFIAAFLISTLIYAAQVSKPCSAILLNLAQQAHAAISEKRTDKDLASKLRAFANDSIADNGGQITNEAVEAFGLARELTPKPTNEWTVDLKVNNPKIFTYLQNDLFQKIEFKTATRTLLRNGQAAEILYGFIIKAFPKDIQDSRLEGLARFKSLNLEDRSSVAPGGRLRPRRITEFLRELTAIAKQSNAAPIERVVVTPHELFLGNESTELNVGDIIEDPQAFKDDIFHFLMAVLNVSGAP